MSLSKIKLTNQLFYWISSVSLLFHNPGVGSLLAKEEVTARWRCFVQVLDLLLSIYREWFP